MVRITGFDSASGPILGNVTTLVRGSLYGTATHISHISRAAHGHAPRVSQPRGREPAAPKLCGSNAAAITEVEF